MKIELEPTGTIENTNGAPCRLWRGTDDQGVYVCAWIALIGADAEHSSQSMIDRFNNALHEVQNSRQLVNFDNRFVV